MASSYTLTPSQQLMENHIAAEVFDSANGYSAFETADGSTVVLAIGSDSILRVNVDTGQAAGGWTTLDLSTEIVLPSGVTATAAAFAASLDPQTNVFYLLLVMAATQGQSNYDLLYMLTGPAGVDPSEWLLQPSQCTWTLVPYDGVSPIGNVSAGTLVIDDVFIEMGIGSQTPSLAIAVVETGIAGSDAVFALNLSGVGQAWQFFPQEQPVDGTGLQMAIGNLRTAGWGIYKLYGPTGSQSLTFLAFNGNEQETSALVYTVPASATAIASLIYTPSNLPPHSYSPPPYSDLYVAGGGTIYRFPYNSMAHQVGTPIVTAYADGVSDLQALNAGDTAFLWWINGANQLVYTSSSITDLVNWAPPVVLQTGVTMASPLSGSSPATCGICAYGTLPTNSNTAAITSGPILIARNPTTTLWTSTILPTPSTTDCITLQTYTTRVLIQQGNTTCTLQSVAVQPSIDCTLIVNGQATPVQAGATVQLQTDNSGFLTLIYPASGLAGLTFTLTLPDSSTATVDAAANTVATLQGVTASTLQTAQCANSTTGSYSLITGKGQGSAGQVAPIVAQLANYSTGLPRAYELSAEKRAARLQPHCAPRPSDGSAIEMALADLVQFASNVIEDVADVIWDGVNLAITIAGTTFTAVVDCVEDAIHAITAVLAWIGAAFEDVFRWLAFIFQWSDIIAVYGQFKLIMQAPFTALLTPTQGGSSTVGADIFNAMSTYIGNVSSTIDPSNANGPLAKVGSGTPSSSVNAQTPPPQPNGANLQNDSRLGWINDRMSTPPTNASSAVLRAAKDNSPAFQAFQTAATSFWGSFGNVETLVENGLTNLFSANGDAGSFLQSIIDALAVAGLDTANDVAQALAAAIPELVGDVNGVLNQDYQIPVLSALFSAATDDDLSLLHLACLASALVFTIGYKIVEDSSPVEALTNANFASAVTSAITNLPQSILAMSTGTRRPRVGGPARVGDPDLPMGANTATGWLLIGQSITAATMGIAEMTEYEGFAGLSYAVDLLLRIARGSIEVANDDNSWAAADMVQIELCFNIGMVFCNLLLDSSVFRIVDALVSPFWGTWEIVSACGSSEGINGGQVMEAGLEFFEPVVALSAPYTEDNVDMTALCSAAIGMRIFCAIGAGAVRLMGDGSSRQEVARPALATA